MVGERRFQSLKSGGLVVHVGQRECILWAFCLSRYWAQVHRAKLVVADRCPLRGFAYIQGRHASDSMAEKVEQSNSESKPGNLLLM